MDEFFFQSYCVTVYYLSTNQQKLNFTAFFSHFPSTWTKFSDMQTHDGKKAKRARTDGRTGNVRIHCQLRRIASHINPITWRGRLGSRPDCFQWIDKIGIDNHPDSSLAVFLSGLFMIPLQIEKRNLPGPSLHLYRGTRKYDINVAYILATFHALYPTSSPYYSFKNKCGKMYSSLKNMWF